MKCFRCNETETDLGKMHCPECLTVLTKSESEPGKKQRSKPQLGTVIFFCHTCHVEVYRHQHVRLTRKPQRQWEEIKKQARMGLVQHMLRVGHTSAALSGDLWINEESGDDGFEVDAAGEKCPAHMQASRVLGLNI